MYAEPTNLLQKNKRIEERNKVEQTYRDDLSRRIEFVDGGSEGRSQTSVTRALRAAMTSAEFQRRDASRARGPKVSTGMLAHGFVPWKTCRERERERRSGGVLQPRGALEGVEYGEGRKEEGEGGWVQPPRPTPGKNDFEPLSSFRNPRGESHPGHITIYFLLYPFPNRSDPRRCRASLL